MTRSLLLILAFLSLFTPVQSQIILSEIMFNAAGNERYNEFIEIFNSSAQTVDLSGWMIGDSDKYSPIIALDQGLLLQPGQYGLILVPTYFTASNQYAGLIPASALLLTTTLSQLGANGLANDRAETVYLYRADSSVADCRQYHIPNDDGISDEKRLLTGGNEDTNWGHSLTVNGSPGAVNSIAPKEYDAALNIDSLHITPGAPAWGTPITIEATIENAGVKELNDIRIIVAIRSFADAALPAVVDSCVIHYLPPQQSTGISMIMHNIPSGADSLTIRVVQAQDQEPANNFYAGELVCGYPELALVINEVMFAPLSGLSDWVELFNPGFKPVTIKDWQIKNEHSARIALTDSLIIIPPRYYVVIAQDSTIFKVISSPAPVVICNKFPSLGNDTDSLAVFDGAGMIIDRLSWTSGAENKRGISLERVNPDNPSNYKNNWTCCLAGDGHTAGQVNSVYSKNLPAATRLLISPDPFSPDNNGHDDQAAIQYTLPEFTTVINIRIFDVKGRQVRFLQNNQPAAATGTVFWDGRDDEGLCCRVGIYIIMLEARNSRDEWLEKVYGTLVLAKNL
ncbi:MAG TPA: lamin tail domain-containing protein [bacterium]|nr:lamin tail domain-containing protein [bacterium]HPN42842.1 lamin tail domain-containing protein [bacterium]